VSPNKPVSVRTRRWVVMLALFVIPVLPVAAWVVGSQINTNCDGLHKIVVVGGEIIADGKGDLLQYRNEGLLTQQQYERALEKTNERYRRWMSADCK
jgi:hypothetical protein